MYYLHAGGQVVPCGARNDNHAIRRIVKTLSSSRRYGIHQDALIFDGKRKVARISLNKALGGALIINEQPYDKHTWYKNFPG